MPEKKEITINIVPVIIALVVLLLVYGYIHFNIVPSLKCSNFCKSIEGNKLKTSGGYCYCEKTIDDTYRLEFRKFPISNYTEIMDKNFRFFESIGGEIGFT